MQIRPGLPRHPSRLTHASPPGPALTEPEAQDQLSLSAEAPARPASRLGRVGGLALLGLGATAALTAVGLLGPATPAVAGVLQDPGTSLASPRRYVPRSLPLRGPDYSLSIRRGNPLGDVSIDKRGSTLRIAHASNAAESAVVEVGPDSIAVRRVGRPSTFLRQSGNQITILRPNGGGPNLTITHLGERIVVDRQNNAGDVAFGRSGNQFAIDRYGLQNDVLITTSPNRTLIDRFQDHQDTVITTLPGGELDPVTWQSELSLDPQGWEILNKWFDEGRLTLDDLVTVTESGQVLEWDGLLH